MANSIHEKYLEAEVFGADSVKLVHMLYRGAIEAAGAARRHLADGDIRQRSRQITRAWEILQELGNSLDRERGGDIGENLGRLYAYMQTRLIEANANQNGAPLAEVESLLTTLNEAWSRVLIPAARSDMDLLTAKTG